MLAKKRAKTVAGKNGDVLLIIDTINDLEFPGAQNLLPWAERLAPRLARFRGLARRAKIPVVYVNDNFGLWHGDFSDVYRHCTQRSARGRDVSRKLKPGRNDYFILKPRHSAFFATSLVPLLDQLQAKRLILTGMATNLCILFSAHDAHMHGYPMIVLSDCCAAESDFDHNVALEQLKRFCRATVCRSEEYVASAAQTRR